MSRLERDRKLAASLLQEHFAEMKTLVEHRRSSRATSDTITTTGHRRIRECIAVLVVEEPDGTESLAIVGDPDQLPLSVKGTLHDAIYALAHGGEPGFDVPL